VSPPRWHRSPDGYYADSDHGRWWILRHQVDDRAYDGGRAGTYWICHNPEGDPYEQHTTLAAAKRDVARAIERRDVIEPVAR
jgi:hypothetical protein